MTVGREIDSNGSFPLSMPTYDVDCSYPAWMRFVCTVITQLLDFLTVSEDIIVTSGSSTVNEDGIV